MDVDNTAVETPEVYAGFDIDMRLGEKIIMDKYLHKIESVMNPVTVQQ